jgi:hypothetical protein
VRVWHPDRFQSTPDLQNRAAQQLQRINEAYLTLKNARIFHRRPEWPIDGEPEESAYTVSVRPSLRRTLDVFLRGLQLYRPVCVLALGVIWLIPAALVWRALSVLQLAKLDSSLIESGLRKPAILTPSWIVNPFADLSVNSDVLAAWARGEGVDLWRPLPMIGEKWPEPATAPRTDARIQPRNMPPHEVPRHQRATAVALPMPENGTEILWTRELPGVGELCVTNETNFDALATLVQARRKEPVRAIYIQAKNNACIRDIGAGTYDLVADLGENWDPKNLRFRAERHSLERAGPFAFFDVTSAEGRSGCRYDVGLRTR